MSQAMIEKNNVQWYNDKPCRFIATTTGPERVAQTLQSKGYEPQVTVFSMSRPVLDLENHLSLDHTARLCCRRHDMHAHDVLSAFSMSCIGKGNPLPMPPLPMPVAHFPPTLEKTKRRQCTVKTSARLAAEIVGQPIQANEGASK